MKSHQHSKWIQIYCTCTSICQRELLEVHCTNHWFFIYHINLYTGIISNFQKSLSFFLHPIKLNTCRHVCATRFHCCTVCIPNSSTPKNLLLPVHIMTKMLDPHQLLFQMLGLLLQHGTLHHVLDFLRVHLLVVRVHIVGLTLSHGPLDQGIFGVQMFLFLGGLLLSPHLQHNGPVFEEC